MKNEEIIKHLQNLGENLHLLAKALEKEELLFDEEAWLEPEASQPKKAPRSETDNSQTSETSKKTGTRSGPETVKAARTNAPPKQAAFPNLGGLNKLSPLPPLPGLSGMGGMGALGGIGGMAGLGGMENIKSLKDIQNNPELMSVLQNLQSNPDSLNAVASMSGLDANTVKNAISSLTMSTPNTAENAAPPTKGAEPAASAAPSTPVNSILNNILSGGQGQSGIFNQILGGSSSQGISPNAPVNPLRSGQLNGPASAMTGAFTPSGALTELLTHWNWHPS